MNSNTQTVRVLVWNEFVQEKNDPPVQAVYPEGIHTVIAGFLNELPGIEAKTATLEMPEHGLTEQALENTDVLIWWGHQAHDKVDDEIVKRVQTKVLEGMGLIVLHSAHHSKIFKTMMGTTCSLKWRDAAEKERLWNIAPDHPITQGIGEYFELPNVEMYGEQFYIPEPDRLIFMGWYPGGEVFRSGCVWNRGAGKVFYFQPGHETYPIFRDANIQRVLENACRWAKPLKRVPDNCPWSKPIEDIGWPKES